MTITMTPEPKAPDLKILAALLCSAFEGTNSGWYCIEGSRKPEVLEFVSDGLDSNPCHVDYPLNEGGAVLIEDLEAGHVHELTLDRCLRGWQVMQEQEPKQWARALSDEPDMNTGDCFLQCCLFGEVIYG